MKRTPKVLIAYDGSPGADIAIENLRNSGLPDDSESLILTVLAQDLSVSTHSILLNDPSRQSGPGPSVAYEQAVDGRAVENEGRDR